MKAIERSLYVMIGLVLAILLDNIKQSKKKGRLQKCQTTSTS